MPRDKAPFRADHVGRLRRPPAMLEARGSFAAGRISAEALSEVEHDAIRDVGLMQEAVGLQSAADGAFRRVSGAIEFVSGIDGISKAMDDPKVQFCDEEGTIEFTPAALKIDGKLGIGDTSDCPRVGGR